MKTKLLQIERDISASGKSGTTTYRFVSLPRDGAYTPFARPESIGGIVTARAGNSARAADRHSATEVEVDLPEGALVKTVRKDQRRGSSISVAIVRGDALVPARYVGARKAGGGWESILEIDGQRVVIAG